MASFNRQPFSVNLPSNSDAKDYYFNHYNWKGLSDDKNFLTADQETFEDCNNVYMDSEGLLRSRPALDPVKGKGETSKLWKLGNYILRLGRVINNEGQGVEKLFLFNLQENDTIYSIDYDDLLGNYTSDGPLLPPIPILVENFLFLLSNVYFKVIDLTSPSVGGGSKLFVQDAYNHVYIPVTKVTTGNTTSDNESKNILTSQTSHVYNISKELPIPSKLYGKSVEMTYGDDETIIIDKVNYIDNLLFLEALGNVGKEEDVYFDVKTYAGKDSWFIFDKNSKLFKYGPDVTDMRETISIKCDLELKRKPQFSSDGTFVYVITTEDEVYRISVVKDVLVGSELQYRYKTFEQLIVKDSSNTMVSGFCGAAFLNYNNYVVLYKRVDSEYTGMYVIKNGVVSTDHLYISENLESANKYYSYVTYYDDRLISLFQFDKKLFIFRGLDLSNTYYNVNSVDQVRVNDNLYIFRQDDNDKHIHRVTWELYTDVFLDELEIAKTSGDVTFKVKNPDTIYVTNGIYEKGELHEFHNAPSNNICVAVNESGISYYLADGDLYTNEIITPITLKETVTPDKNDVQYHISQLVNNFSYYCTDRLYLASGTNFYVSEHRESNLYSAEGKKIPVLYIPEKTKQTFSENICAITPISSDEIGIFFNDSVWRCVNENDAYHYYKTRLSIGPKNGSDIISSYDGSNIIFSTDRGLAVLSYQDFVATTEQQVSYISDTISSLYNRLFKGQVVKLIKHKFWLICYRNYYDTSNGAIPEALVLDFRNNSWWKITINHFSEDVQCLSAREELVIVNDGKVYLLQTGDEDYYDVDYRHSLGQSVVGEVKLPIDWYIKSQKLHLNQINNYKHVAGVTLLSVLDSNKPMQFKLKSITYRKKKNTREMQTTEYTVDSIRTYFKRVNLSKVNEVQFEIYSDDESYERVPLSLSGITVKYRIGSQVR